MSTRVLILGAGGHAWVIADILFRMQQAGQDVVPVGYLDDNIQLVGQSMLGLSVMGVLSSLHDQAHDAVVIAIGHNRTRQRLFSDLQERGERFVVARHPRSIVAPDVRIGTGTMICAGAIVNPGSVVGDNVILNTGCTVDHHNLIGDHVHIAPGVHLGGEVAIGEGTLVGIGSTVIPQHTIGAWSVIGAGSLVSKNIPDWSTAVGVPARVIHKQLTA